MLRKGLGRVSAPMLDRLKTMEALDAVYALCTKQTA